MATAYSEFAAMTRRVSSSSAEEVVRHWNVRDAMAHLTRRSAMRAVLYEAFQQLPEVVTVDDPDLVGSQRTVTFA